KRGRSHHLTRDGRRRERQAGGEDSGEDRRPEDRQVVREEGEEQCPQVADGADGEQGGARAARGAVHADARSGRTRDAVPDGYEAQDPGGARTGAAGSGEGVRRFRRGLGRGVLGRAPKGERGTWRRIASAWT